jgi:UDP-4-amino-4,6-dideoxy-N-acetyl-beta-L-altrosamine N-acetyltransferase
MPPAFLSGTHVYLRALERADAPTILPWVNDQQVIQHLLIHKPMNLAAEEAFIDAVNRSDHDVAFGICETTTHELIGVAGLHRVDAKNRHAMFGIFIGAAAHRGKGYGTEVTAMAVRYAFDTLNLHRVWLHVYEDNKGAIRAYEKVGFKTEGVLRQDSFRRGRYWNTVTMGVLRADVKKPARR